jgi:hypothetical protein
MAVFPFWRALQWAPSNFKAGMSSPGEIPKTTAALNCKNTTRSLIIIIDNQNEIWLGETSKR